MTAFYNERDPYAAEWLRNLIAAGHIAPGVVSEEDIRDLRPIDLMGYTQCHFFAGIGVWSYALRRAGWPDDEPIWTGSCPCQPFSAAGRRAGVADERHLWPHWFWLIDQCRPPIVLGEQVASKDGLGWLDLVSADMEGAGYAFGASDLCAAGFGGAHIRQRLYFVGLADAAHQQQHGRGDAGQGRRLEYPVGGGAGGLADASVARFQRGKRRGSANEEGQSSRHSSECCGANGLADALPAGRPERGAVAGSGQVAGWGEFVGLADAPMCGREPREGDGGIRGQDVGARQPTFERGAVCPTGGLADADGRNASAERQQPGGQYGQQPQDGGELDRPHAPLLGRHPADWLFCRDGKWRPVEPGTFPLAHAAPARVGRLRAYGNALDAETATEFVGAVRFILAHPLPALKAELPDQIEMFP